MISPYYGGNGSSIGRVEPLHHPTFPDLVKEVLSHPILLPLTRASYAALPTKEERDRAKRTRFVVAATFPDSDVRRTEHAGPCNLVFLDIDTNEHNDPQKVLDLGSDLGNALSPFSFALWHTASSTPTKPRLRLCVAAESLPLQDYPRAVNYLGSLLGLAEVTRESRVAVQPQYLPVVFRDQSLDTDHPLVWTNLAGRPIVASDLQDLGPIEPLRRSNAPDATPDDLDFLRHQVEEVTPEVAKELLARIDPDCDRKTWVIVAAGLKHQFGDEGLELWREWSAKGTKFPGDESVETQWRSLRPSPRGRAPTTVRTLIKFATDAGWDSTLFVRQCYDGTRAWIESTERTQPELMHVAVRRIAATPMLSALEIGGLLAALQLALRNKGCRVTRADINRQWKQVASEGRGKGETASVPDDQMPVWARGITYVASGNEFYRYDTGQKWSVEALNNTFAVHLTSQTEESAEGRPELLPRDYLLNKLRIPRVDGYLYDPTRPGEKHITYDRKRYLNTYRMTHPEPDPRRADEAGRVLLSHADLVLGGGWVAQRFIDWMAYIVQNPGGKVLWAPLLQSAEGGGKTFFPQVLRAVLGESNVKEVGAHAVIHSQWTEWAADCQLVVLEEVRVIGENRHAVMNKLKPLITNKVVSVEQRGEDTRSIPNYANYLLTSNFQDALALTKNDRRYFVIFSPLQTEAQVKRIGKPYFDKLYRTLEENAGGLRSFLLDWSISDEFDPSGPAPVTKHKGELVRAASSPTHRAVAAALEAEASALVRSDLVGLAALISAVANTPGCRDSSMNTVESCLRELGYVAHARLVTIGEPVDLWVPHGCTLTPDEAAALAVMRVDGEDIL
jgi:hypothetical protein